MAKNYTEELGEWIKQKDSSKRNKNLVAFLAIKNDVKEAIDAGFAVKIIWANLVDSKRITFSYETFLNYVNRYLRHPQKTSTPSSSSKIKTKKPDKPEESATPGFTFNPIPNKKDLF